MALRRITYNSGGGGGIASIELNALSSLATNCNGTQKQLLDVFPLQMLKTSGDE